MLKNHSLPVYFCVNFQFFLPKSSVAISATQNNSIFPSFLHLILHSLIVKIVLSKRKLDYLELCQKISYINETI